jgi:DNA-binding transcriptional MerR regulator
VLKGKPRPNATVWTEERIDALKALYCDDCYGIREISDLFGMRYQQVQSAIKNFGLKQNKFARSVLRKRPDLRRVWVRGGEVSLRDVLKNEAQKATAEKAAEDRAVRQAWEYANVDGVKRNDAIQTLRDAGVTLEEIGQHYGISRERVRQLTCPLEKFKRAASKARTKQKRDARKVRLAERRKQSVETLTDFEKMWKALDKPAFCSVTGVSIGALRNHFNRRVFPAKYFYLFAPHIEAVGFTARIEWFDFVMPDD